MESPVLWLSCSLQQKWPAWRDVIKKAYGVWGHLSRNSHDQTSRNLRRPITTDFQILKVHFRPWEILSLQEDGLRVLGI